MTVDAIQLDQVEKRFGAFWCLRRLDLSFKAGNFVLVAGPNGAGKTTLLRLTAGLARPTSGRVLLHGEEPTRSGHARASVGWVSHQALLYDHLTAAENLSFYAHLYQMDHRSDRIREALAASGLESREDSRVRTFSRGMKQRLALARATLHNPSILLFDEPYTGLDQHAAAALTLDLEAQRQSGRTCVLVTHRPEVAAGLVNQILILQEGRVCHLGSWSGGTQSQLRELYSQHTLQTT
jgi:heme exporter protein A